jgi:Uma2 family endonuclease
VNAALRKQKWTAERFLEWSAGQAVRYELENGQIIELAAEKARHALMKHAATVALERAIANAGLPCAVFPDGMSVVVDKQTVRLPDAAVQCSPIDLDSTILDQPIVLLEVTSPSSVYRDERHKLLEYFLIPSVIHYLLLSPDDRLVVHFRRSEEPDRFETKMMREGLLELTPPGIFVNIHDLLGTLPSNAMTRS